MFGDIEPVHSAGRENLDARLKSCSTGVKPINRGNSRISSIPVLTEYFQPFRYPSDHCQVKVNQQKNDEWYPHEFVDFKRQRFGQNTKGNRFDNSEMRNSETGHEENQHCSKQQPVQDFPRISPVHNHLIEEWFIKISFVRIPPAFPVAFIISTVG